MTYTTDDLNISESLVVNERDGFKIVTTFEDEWIDPKDMFDDERDIIQAVYNGDVTWLIMIVTAYKHGIEIGSANLGGCSYSRMDDMLSTDGYYADLINDAVSEAKENIKKLCNGD